MQLRLLLSPDEGDLIKGTGGIRKIRIGTNGRGKSGSVRVCYFDIPEANIIYLITAYAKNEQSNLTKEECADLRKLTAKLKSIYRNNRRGNNESV